MRKYYPNYSIGTDAYADIPMVCEKYGTKAVIIGGTHALAAAADLIKEAVADSNIMITGVFEYGGEASREHIDELNSHQEVIDADMIFACVVEKRLILVKYCHRKATDHSLHSQRLLLLVLLVHHLVSSIIQMVPFVNILSKRNLLNGSLSIHK